MAASPKPSRALARAAFPRFYPIVDTAACRAVGCAPLAVTRACLDGGARLLQLRAKDEPDSEFLRLADAIVLAAHAAAARVIVNDRADIAAMASADGVHVGQDDLPPAAVRRIVPHALVGLSAHTAAQIEGAARQPVDYIAVGPVFGTVTKETGYAAVGLELVALASRLGVPVVAIGGITLDRAPRVVDAGATSVAVIGDLFAGDIEERVRRYVRILG